VSDDAWLAQRLRIVLETPRGSLPWRPDFGCDLGRFVAQALTPSRLEAVKREVEGSLRREFSDVRVVDVDVQALTTHGLGQGRNRRMLPIAERSLVQLGTHCTLQVGITIEFNGRAVFFEVQLQG
jgi:phage baseplate assembly protein W